MSAQLPVRSRGTLTVLVKQQDIATGEIDGVSSAQAGHWELWSDASDYDLGGGGTTHGQRRRQ